MHRSRLRLRIFLSEYDVVQLRLTVTELEGTGSRLPEGPRIDGDEMIDLEDL